MNVSRVPSADQRTVPLTALPSAVTWVAFAVRASSIRPVNRTVMAALRATRAVSSLGLTPATEGASTVVTSTGSMAANGTPFASTSPSSHSR